MQIEVETLFRGKTEFRKSIPSQTGVWDEDNINFFLPQPFGRGYETTETGFSRNFKIKVRLKPVKF